MPKRKWTEPPRDSSVVYESCNSGLGTTSRGGPNVGRRHLPPPPVRPGVHDGRAGEGLRLAPAAVDAAAPGTKSPRTRTLGRERSGPNQSGHEGKRDGPINEAPGHLVGHFGPDGHRRRLGETLYRAQFQKNRLAGAPVGHVGRRGLALGPVVVPEAGGTDPRGRRQRIRSPTNAEGLPKPSRATRKNWGHVDRPGGWET